MHRVTNALASILRGTVQRVQTIGSYNVISLGTDAPNSWLSVTIAQNTFLNFTNAAIVLHGGGGQLFVTGNAMTGATPGPTSSSAGAMALDASDAYSTTAQYVANNTFQSLANGLVYILNPGPSPTPSTSYYVGDSFFDSNTLSNIFGAGFYILAYPNQATGAPLTQRIKIRNSTILSDWDGVYLDGGGYSSGGTQNRPPVGS